VFGRVLRVLVWDEKDKRLKQADLIRSDRLKKVKGFVGTLKSNNALLK